VPAPPLSPSPAETLQTATAGPVIAGFDGSEASFAAIHEAIETSRSATLRQAGSSLSSDNPVERFAAVYTLGLTVGAEDVDFLRPVLADSDPALRTIAAGSLIGLGVEESLPVLIGALDSEAVLPFSHPPRPVWRLAHDALHAYTGQNFEPAAGSVPQASLSAAWREWWESNGGRMRWDGSQWEPLP
jgi:hypothetical protein